MTSTEGIILRRIPYRSSGAVIDILTPTGKTGALLKGLDKKNSAVRLIVNSPVRAISAWVWRSGRTET